jgi:Prolyl oligopeptidase family
MRKLAPIVAALLLGACGQDKKPDVPATPAPPVSSRGTLLSGSPEFVSTVTAPGLLLQLSTSANQQLLALGGSPLCDIAVYHIRYNTVGGANESTTASGALMVPTGSDASCSGSRPIILYAHGTNTDKAFNIANLQDPQNAEGLLMAAFFVSHGYIVVAPNYAGFDTSTLAYHPYLVADQQSKDMIDALTAARSAMPVAAAATTRDSGRLFITGYSQGGYVAMATHRAMQAGGMTVTASAPMSGPYAMAAFVDSVFYGQVPSGAPVLTTLLFSGYQKSYGNIYASTDAVFEAPYATGLDSLLPSTTTRSQLYAQGKLPKNSLFNTVPPDTASASLTPPVTPANLAPVFALGFGTDNLIKNSYRLSFLQDARANPDGGWPTTTTGVPAATPALAMRQALKLNDLRNWIPTSPILLCGGNADPSVYWLNTQLILGYWASHATSPTPSAVLDLDASVVSGDPNASLKGQFTVAKQVTAAAAVLQGASDGGAAAVADAYHSTLVPPFCLSAVKSFFAAQ